MNAASLITCTNFRNCPIAPSNRKRDKFTSNKVIYDARSQLVEEQSAMRAMIADGVKVQRNRLRQPGFVPEVA
ncbi:hypothetical protein [Paraburkholderia antibiotica]|uniref:Uncharacterized protein n=1 Tax=Paraburkholderia antibiotica TaxID=2728839 RepID=A0A7Y0A112_9BURK|nr:hypothetical protein [Paraburkholderia antibiotica]NML34536.1 hypothetical protein [Paraburkholderia antibiotica]